MIIVLGGEKDHVFETEIFFEGLSIASIAINTKSLKGSFKILLQDTAHRHWNFYEDMAWSPPENPRLFAVHFSLKGSHSVTDEVQSYFGMRKISIENGIFMLNNRPYFQRLVLDQGYWPESLMTAPSDDSFVEDIKLVKAMGFNGVRKHQKVEDPRFLFHADKMGGCWFGGVRLVQRITIRSPMLQECTRNGWMFLYVTIIIHVLLFGLH